MVGDDGMLTIYIKALAIVTIASWIYKRFVL